jgi:hypothetical protein
MWCWNSMPALLHIWVRDISHASMLYCSRSICTWDQKCISPRRVSIHFWAPWLCGLLLSYLLTLLLSVARIKFKGTDSGFSPWRRAKLQTMPSPRKRLGSRHCQVQPSKVGLRGFTLENETTKNEVCQCHRPHSPRTLLQNIDCPTRILLQIYCKYSLELH